MVMVLRAKNDGVMVKRSQRTFTLRITTSFIFIRWKLSSCKYCHIETSAQEPKLNLSQSISATPNTMEPFRTAENDVHTSHSRQRTFT